MPEWIVLGLLLFGAPDAPKSCVIVQHAERLTGIATWSRRRDFPFEYVSGEFPKAVKFKSRLKDGDVTKLRDRGARVIILPQKFQHTDLEQAQQQCKQFQESK